MKRLKKILIVLTTLILSGWLYRTACHLAGHAVRAELRRVAREQIAAAQMIDQTPDSLWRDIEGELDEAMETLGDDDRDAVQKLACLTKPGGAVIVSVPALPDLYSEFDEVQGHRRRYMPDTLRAVFAGSGLVVERDLWWGAWMVPVVRHQRRRPSRRDPEVSADAAYLSYLRLPPWPFPSLMMAAYRLERRKALRGRLRTGTSLFAIARRTVPSSGSAPA